jgi:hypothetical protein
MRFYDIESRLAEIRSGVMQVCGRCILTWHAVGLPKSYG